jgi:hypothetical protein
MPDNVVLTAEEKRIAKKKTSRQLLRDRYDRLAAVPDPVFTGGETEVDKRLIQADHVLHKARIPSIRPLLPRLFCWDGQPFTIDNHFPMEPVFRTAIPPELLLKAGRQVAKTTTMAAFLLAMARSVPYLKVLCITPLYEQIRRFSHSYVRKFIDESPIRDTFVDDTTVNQILQRSFINGASLYFSFALLDAERARGIPSDFLFIDELQNVFGELVPILVETQSASPLKIKRYAGTPKSLDNPIQTYWGDSSQAEWIIKCDTGGCGHWNVPSLEQDLLDMTGPYRDDISEQSPGLVCSKCRKPLRPRTGRWYHLYKEKKDTFPAYHLPQQIFPMHYADRDSWDVLLGKWAGRRNTTFTQFLNEVCGESYDVGSKLVTETDLRNAAVLPWRRRLVEAEKHLGQYTHRILAVDWGGGGGRLRSSLGKDDDKRLRTSFTTLSALGRRPDGKIHCIWGHRSLRTHDMRYEAQLCVEAMARLRCSHLVHDYGGAGAAREVFIHQMGVPYHNIVPIAYVGPARQGPMQFHPATDDHPRDYYSVDKSYTLALTAMAIKYGLLQFFAYDHVSNDDPGLLHDFLSLIEEKIEMPRSRDIYQISKNPTAFDDFAQATNIGCCVIWYLSRSWPNFAEMEKMTIPESLWPTLAPLKVNWEEI